MTDEEIGTRFVQLADAITKVVDAQLSIQQLGGRLSEVVLEVRQEVRELRQGQIEIQQRQAEFQQRQAELQQRQAESDQRFEILLQEIRFLIRNPPREQS